MGLTLLNMLASNAAIKSIPYSEFLRLAEEGKVAEVAVTDNTIQGKLNATDGPSGQAQRFETVRVDPDISPLLDENNIGYAGRIQSNFLATLLSWMIPVLLFRHLVFHDEAFPAATVRFHDPRKKQGQDLHGERCEDSL